MAVLLRRADPVRLADITVQNALTNLHMSDLSNADVTGRLTADPAVFTLTDPRRPAADQPLKLTPHGRRLAAEFRAARESLAMFRAAQHAVLLWCAAHPASQFLPITDLLTEPGSWFYGTQFSPHCLLRAANALTTAGYLFTVPTAEHPVIQLAPAGVRWIDQITPHLDMTTPLPPITALNMP